MSRPLDAERLSSRGDAKPYAVFDLETDGLRGPLLYWAAGCECHATISTGTTVETLWRHLLSRQGRDHVWWAHNGGSYDHLYLFEIAKREALAGRAVVSPIVRGDAMIGLRVQHGARADDRARHGAWKYRTDLRDSMAVLPAGLAELAAQLAPELPKLDIGLAEGVTFDPANADHRAYAERDVRATLAVVVRFREIIGQGFPGVLPGWSLAATALRAWRSTIPEGVRYWPAPEPVAVFARRGYYGGHVHLGRRALGWTAPATGVDANSMYPTVMRSGGVPDGWALPVRKYDPRRPGMYEVTADVSRETPFTFLPYRDPRGQMAWPTGRFRTVLSSIEIEAARARGVEITVHRGYVWSRLVHPFGAFVDRIEEARRAGGAMAYVFKILANALYGKFGSRPTHDEWTIAEEPPGRDWWPLPGASEDERLRGVWIRNDVPLRAPYLLPHWAAWITAGARLALLGIAEAIGADLVLYCDTDSAVAPAEAVGAAIDAGRLVIDPFRFGACKVEHRYLRFRVHAPKVTEGYEWCEIGGDHRHGRTPAEGPHELAVLRAKGIPRGHIAEAFDVGEVRWSSPNGAMAVLSGAAMMTERHRTLSHLAASVAWTHHPDGAVRPVHIAAA